MNKTTINYISELFSFTRFTAWFFGCDTYDLQQEWENDNE